MSNKSKKNESQENDIQAKDSQEHGSLQHDAFDLENDLAINRASQPADTDEPEAETDRDTDTDTDADELSEQDYLLKELENDYSESEMEELEALQDEFASNVQSQAVGLVNKLNHTGGNFPVSDRSKYIDPIWRLAHGKHAFPNNIRFNRKLAGSNDLKRAMLYHVIPEFSPFSYIRSYTTAKAYGNEYAILEKYIFENNALTAKPEHIAMISVPLIERAFEAAKQSEAKHHYFALFKHLRLWINLSEHRLIPEELRLDIALEHIDAPDRRLDVLRSRFKGTMDGWVSYSEEDLEVLINHAMFWVEGVMPQMKKLKDYLVESKLAFLSDKVATRADRLLELEELMTIKVGDKTVMRPRFRQVVKEGWVHYSYTWVEEYAPVLDGIRNAVFILLALITGARKSELAVMNFADLTQEANGDYWMKITRWKTAASPTHGEEDQLPIPKFIGDLIRQFEDLRNFPPFVKQGWIFQPLRSTKVVKKATPSLINYVINELKAELPIERLHCHRFRKTIAEILINRDERNVDIIRALFGHKSYAMTLRYIARNPFMVRSVAFAIEQNYTREFHQIVAGIQMGAHSGDAARRIYEQILKRPDEFTGKQLKVSLIAYISHLLTAGEPIFIRRTAMGAYCLTGEHFTAENLPPCLHGRTVDSEVIMPDPSNCQIQCKKLVVLESGKRALSDNMAFYTNILEATAGKLKGNAEYELQRRIAATQVHLNNLVANGHTPSGLIEARNV